MDWWTSSGATRALSLVPCLGMRQFVFGLCEGEVCVLSTAFLSCVPFGLRVRVLCARWDGTVRYGLGGLYGAGGLHRRFG